MKLVRIISRVTCNSNSAHRAGRQNRVKSAGSQCILGRQEYTASVTEPLPWCDARQHGRKNALNLKLEWMEIAGVSAQGFR